ncbi:uncharacterized protein LOC115756018 isoform X2 [Rhodamnia argentea]|uniref:Uncharacterized protein LOC115756018 isoform X2 n=1 Tax=Rhodamnia argentea TaxID=178133 RepID=A0A8B8QZ35_9MYRT|nr:uncharacterized protein LOC115756018 isoform X2 [Rhodamnia argentea]
MANGANSEGLRNLSEVVGFKSRIGRILTSIRRFAVDSAVRESLGGINGNKKATKFMQDGVKDQVLCLSLKDDNGPGDLKVGLNDIHEIMEKRREGLNKVRQEHERSAESVMGSESSKKSPNEGPKQLDLPRAAEKKLFIRSRL